jgi:hypothetical protein
MARGILRPRVDREVSASDVHPAGPAPGEPELLEVRRAWLEGASLWAVRAGGRGAFEAGGEGGPLLHSPNPLLFIIEQNLTPETHSGISRSFYCASDIQTYLFTETFKIREITGDVACCAVPDLTIQGTLATLQCSLDPSQYRLVRGVLAHNLGEDLADLEPLHHVPPHHHQVPCFYNHIEAIVVQPFKLDVFSNVQCLLMWPGVDDELAETGPAGCGCAPGAHSRRAARLH